MFLTLTVLSIYVMLDLVLVNQIRSIDVKARDLGKHSIGRYLELHERYR